MSLLPAKQIEDEDGDKEGENMQNRHDPENTVTQNALPNHTEIFEMKSENMSSKSLPRGPNDFVVFNRDNEFERVQKSQRVEYYVEQAKKPRETGKDTSFVKRPRGEKDDAINPVVGSNPAAADVAFPFPLSQETLLLPPPLLSGNRIHPLLRRKKPPRRGRRPHLERRLGTFTSRIVEGYKETYYVSLEGNRFLFSRKEINTDKMEAKLSMNPRMTHGRNYFSNQKRWNQKDTSQKWAKDPKGAKQKDEKQTNPDDSENSTSSSEDDMELKEQRALAFKAQQFDKSTMKRFGVKQGSNASSRIPKTCYHDVLKRQIERNTRNGSLDLGLNPTNFTKYDLSYYGIPLAVQEKYRTIMKIKRLHDWQAECLGHEDVLEYGHNLVYTAPTSGGKSLIADILMMRRVLFEGKRAIVILPFVSICNEKVDALQAVWGDIVRIQGFYGSSSSSWYPGIDVTVCTIEKATGFLNRWIEEGTISSASKCIGTVVIDELHLISDPDRGYQLELFLLKLRLYEQKMNVIAQRERRREEAEEPRASPVGNTNPSVAIASPNKPNQSPSKANTVNRFSDNRNNVQIIGMSATLPNLDSMARWLDARFYCTSFRPVPLLHKVLLGHKIYQFDQDEIRLFAKNREIAQARLEALALQKETEDAENARNAGKPENTPATETTNDRVKSMKSDGDKPIDITEDTGVKPMNVDDESDNENPDEKEPETYSQPHQKTSSDLKRYSKNESMQTKMAGFASFQGPQTRAATVLRLDDDDEALLSPKARPPSQISPRLKRRRVAESQVNPPEHFGSAKTNFAKASSGFAKASVAIPNSSTKKQRFATFVSMQEKEKEAEKEGPGSIDNILHACNKTFDAPQYFRKDEVGVFAMCYEVMRRHQSCLLFASSRNWTEQLANEYAANLRARHLENPQLFLSSTDGEMGSILGVLFCRVGLFQNSMHSSFNMNRTISKVNGSLDGRPSVASLPKIKRQREDLEDTVIGIPLCRGVCRSLAIELQAVRMAKHAYEAGTTILEHAGIDLETGLRRDGSTGMSALFLEFSGIKEGIETGILNSLALRTDFMLPKREYSKMFRERKAQDTTDAASYVPSLLVNMDVGNSNLPRVGDKHNIAASCMGKFTTSNCDVPDVDLNIAEELRSWSKKLERCAYGNDLPGSGDLPGQNISEKSGTQFSLNFTQPNNSVSAKYVLSLRKVLDLLEARLVETHRVFRSRMLALEHLTDANCGTKGLCYTLQKSVPFGVCYHHANLLSEEKKILERCFRARDLLCICCTSTLAAGVNLPCRRVLLRTLKSGGPEYMEVSKFLQICGRAGRTGYDTMGECVIFIEEKKGEYATMLKKMNSVSDNETRSKFAVSKELVVSSDIRQLNEYLIGQLPPLRSSLTGKRLQRAILDVVALELLDWVGARLSSELLKNTLRGTLIAEQEKKIKRKSLGLTPCPVDKKVHIAASSKVNSRADTYMEVDSPTIKDTDNTVVDREASSAALRGTDGGSNHKPRQSPLNFAHGNVAIATRLVCLPRDELDAAKQALEEYTETMKALNDPSIATKRFRGFLMEDDMMLSTKEKQKQEEERKRKTHMAIRKKHGIQIKRQLPSNFNLRVAPNQFGSSATSSKQFGSTDTSSKKFGGGASTTFGQPVEIQVVQQAKAPSSNLHGQSIRTGTTSSSTSDMGTGQFQSKDVGKFNSGPASAPVAHFGSGQLGKGDLLMAGRSTSIAASFAAEMGLDPKTTVGVPESAPNQFNINRSASAGQCGSRASTSGQFGNSSAAFVGSAAPKVGQFSNNGQLGTNTLNRSRKESFAAGHDTSRSCSDSESANPTTLKKISQFGSNPGTSQRVSQFRSKSTTPQRVSQFGGQFGKASAFPNRLEKIVEGSQENAIPALGEIEANLNSNQQGANVQTCNPNVVTTNHFASSIGQFSSTNNQFGVAKQASGLKADSKRLSADVQSANTTNQLFNQKNVSSTSFGSTKAGTQFNVGNQSHGTNNFNPTGQLKTPNGLNPINQFSTPHELNPTGQFSTPHEPNPTGQFSTPYQLNPTGTGKFNAGNQFNPSARPRGQFGQSRESQFGKTGSDSCSSVGSINTGEKPGNDVSADLSAATFHQPAVIRVTPREAFLIEIQGNLVDLLQQQFLQWTPRRLPPKPQNQQLKDQPVDTSRQKSPEVAKDQSMETTRDVSMEPQKDRSVEASREGPSKALGKETASVDEKEKERKTSSTDESKMETLESLFGELSFTKTEESNSLMSCALGDAATFSQIFCKEAAILYRDLFRARRHGVVLDTELHQLYFCAPLSQCIDLKIDWVVYKKQLEKMDEDMQRVADAIGIEPQFVEEQIKVAQTPYGANIATKRIKAFLETGEAAKDGSHTNVRHRIYNKDSVVVPSLANHVQKALREANSKNRTPESVGAGVNQTPDAVITPKFVAPNTNANNTTNNLKLLTHVRFFLALILYAIVNELDTAAIASKFQISRGQVQQLQSGAGMYCGIIINFCERLNWWKCEWIFRCLQPRMDFGVNDVSILPLVSIGVQPPRARALLQHGLTLEKLARIRNPEDLERYMGQYIDEYDDMVIKGCYLGAAGGYKGQRRQKLAQEIIINARRKIEADVKQVFDEFDGD